MSRSVLRSLIDLKAERGRVPHGEGRHKPTWKALKQFVGIDHDGCLPRRHWRPVFEIIGEPVAARADSVLVVVKSDLVGRYASP
jgi:hypothetical protein